MIVLSMEQCVAVLAVCFFVLGIICDRLSIWFYDQYIATDDDQFTDDASCQEAI